MAALFGSSSSERRLNINNPWLGQGMNPSTAQADLLQLHRRNPGKPLRERHIVENDLDLIGIQRIGRHLHLAVA